MDCTAGITTYIEQRGKQVEDYLKESIPREWDFANPLREAMYYSLLAGGKRIRPILLLAAAESLGGDEKVAMPAAAAIEMVHTYSLVHDDLPAMDNDDYRRGRLTNHKVYGEAMAILAGDGLLTHAFHHLTHGLNGNVPAERILMMVQELSQQAGAVGMVGGQAADMEGEQGVTTLAALDDIHTRKTGALIVFSLRAGGHIAGATDEQLQALERFGSCIGLAFQIQDDILDLTGEEAKIGKPLGSDEAQGKVTYPFLLGLEASRRRMEELTLKGKQAIEQGGFVAPERLLQLADYLVKRDR